eukprot:gene3627-675_t
MTPPPLDFGGTTLDEIRNDLIRMEETIIFALIERAKFGRNHKVYITGELGVQSHESFMQHFLHETEKIHAMMRRYTDPEETAFFADLPQTQLPLLNYKSIIQPNSINVGAKIMSVYTDIILPLITNDVDDGHYGATATCDINALMALSKRVHYGKKVAELKFLEKPEQYSELIQKNDSDGIMELLTNKAVEEKLLARLLMKARKYGQDVVLPASPKPGVPDDLPTNYK